MKTSVRVMAFVLCGVIASLSQDSAPVSADGEKWRADLHYLSIEIQKRHKNLYHSVTPEQFESEVNSLKDRIPSLSRNQILVGIARIVASIGDGHTGLFPRFNPALGLHRYPVKLYFFKDGLFVERAAHEYKEIVG